LATLDDARVHCAVLKIRAVPALPHLSRRGGTGPCRGMALTAVPSGPNSVLGPRALPDSRSWPQCLCNTATCTKPARAGAQTE